MNSDAIAIANDGPTETTEHLLFSDGKIHDLTIIKAVKRNEEGKPIYLVGLAMDVSNLVRRNIVLRETQKQLRQMVLKNEKFIFDERKRIAQSLHDDLGQLLTALHLILSPQSDELLNAETLSETIKEALGLVNECIQTTRRVTSTLRPPPALEHGLPEAMRQLVQQVSRTVSTEIRLSVENFPSTAYPVPGEVAFGAYRLLQEGLTNALKYAQATQINLSIKLSEDQKHLDVSIKDNGVGFNPEDLAFSLGLGISGLRERADTVGGTFDIASQPGMGTLLRMVIPLENSLTRIDDA